MSDDRQAHIFEQQIQRQIKAVNHFIDQAKNIGIVISPEELLQMVQNYKNQLLQEMLQQRLGMATPTEVTSFFEATQRIANKQPTTNTTTNAEPTKKKRKRRTRAQMEALRNAQKDVGNANSM